MKDCYWVILYSLYKLILNKIQCVQENKYIMMYTYVYVYLYIYMFVFLNICNIIRNFNSNDLCKKIKLQGISFSFLIVDL